MCESTVVLRSQDGERVVMENVVHIEVSGEELNLTGIMGERVSVKAWLVEAGLKDIEVEYGLNGINARGVKP